MSPFDEKEVSIPSSLDRLSGLPESKRYSCKYVPVMVENERRLVLIGLFNFYLSGIPVSIECCEDRHVF